MTSLWTKHLMLSYIAIYPRNESSSPLRYRYAILLAPMNRVVSTVRHLRFTKTLFYQIPCAGQITHMSSLHTFAGAVEDPPEMKDNSKTINKLELCNGIAGQKWASWRSCCMTVWHCHCDNDTCQWYKKLIIYQTGCIFGVFFLWIWEGISAFGSRKSTTSGRPSPKPHVF